MPPTPAFKRVLLKISGEALMGNRQFVDLGARNLGTQIGGADRHKGILAGDVDGLGCRRYAESEIDLDTLSGGNVDIVSLLRIEALLCDA